MDTIRGAKILRIILCVGVFIWLVHFNVTQSVGWSIRTSPDRIALHFSYSIRFHTSCYPQLCYCHYSIFRYCDLWNFQDERTSPNVSCA